MNDFIDPPNATEVIQEVLQLTIPEKIQDYIENVYPGWLVYALDKYSDDYPHLQANWKKICELSNVKPKKIVLVADIKFDDSHKVIRAFCEYMTKCGYVVRRAGEFVACGSCMAAIPCQDIYKLLKSKNLPVPKIWSNRCNSC